MSSVMMNVWLCHSKDTGGVEMCCVVMVLSREGVAGELWCDVLFLVVPGTEKFGR